jgi:hypothetical protein
MNVDAHKKDGNKFAVHLDWKDGGPVIWLHEIGSWLHEKGLGTGASLTPNQARRLSASLQYAANLAKQLDLEGPPDNPRPQMRVSALNESGRPGENAAHVKIEVGTQVVELPKCFIGPLMHDLQVLTRHDVDEDDEIPF